MAQRPFFAMIVALCGTITQPLFAHGPAVPAPTLQAQFNAATDAWERGDCATAMPLFEQLAANPHVKPGSLPAATIDLRRGDCLLKQGKSAEGETLLIAALPKVAAAGHDFDLDVGMTHRTLGVLAALRWDHDTAVAHFDAALAVQKGDERLATLAGLAVVTAFDGGTRSLSASEEGLAIVSAAAKPANDALAQWHSLHARTLLNQGRAQEGYDELKLAYKYSGADGRTTLTVADTLIRSDLAQAAILNGKRTDAYEYMARSGAGRVEKSPFARPTDISAPDCGPETGLSPDDMAVVEFAIDADGSVASAQTVYGRFNYAKAAAFARAVRDWKWRAEDVAKIPDFFRVAARVELRCSNAGAGAGMDLLGPVADRFTHWADDVLRTYPPAPSQDQQNWQPWLALADAARAKGDAPAEFAARVVLAGWDLRRQADIDASRERALALAETPSIPAQARTAALLLLEVWGKPACPIARAKCDSRYRARLFNDRLLALAADTRFQDDALVQDSAIALGLPQRPVAADAARTTEWLNRLANDARLPDRHPLRQWAALRLANDSAAAGRLDEAQKWFAATGLSEEQCALLGPQPAYSGGGAGSFPVDALIWGFEGWVKTEFDISADGAVIRPRAIMAYPPLIFRDAAVKMVSAARYQKTYRPGGGAGCSAAGTTINFRIPGNDATTKAMTRPKKP